MSKKNKIISLLDYRNKKHQGMSKKQKKAEGGDVMFSDSGAGASPSGVSQSGVSPSGVSPSQKTNIIDIKSFKKTLQAKSDTSNQKLKKEDNRASFVAQKPETEKSKKSRLSNIIDIDRYRLKKQPSTKLQDKEPSKWQSMAKEGLSFTATALALFLALSVFMPNNSSQSPNRGLASSNNSPKSRVMRGISSLFAVDEEVKKNQSQRLKDIDPDKIETGTKPKDKKYKGY